MTVIENIKRFSTYLQSVDLRRIDELVDVARSQEEKELFFAITNFVLQTKQKAVLAREEEYYSRQKGINVDIIKDDEAGVWVAICDEIGIAMESDSYEELVKRVEKAVLELKRLNNKK